MASYAPVTRVATRPQRLVRRAVAAYYRAEGFGKRYPSGDGCRVENMWGREYVVLHDGRAVIAVYRLRHVPGRPDGMLRRMKRWPATIR